MRRHPMNPVTLIPALVAAACLAAAPAMGETYKWTDAEGKIHYSDQPPPQGAKQESKVKARKPTAAAPPSDAAASGKEGAPKAKTYQEQEADFKKRQVETAEKDAAEKKKIDEAAEKSQNCEQAKAQLANLQGGGRMTRTNSKGEREFMTDQQVAQEIERGKKAVTTWCK